MRALMMMSAILMALACHSGPAKAAGDTAAVQNVIRLQEDAISRNDADAAYSYAAPMIQGMFPDAQIFMQMVLQGYAPLYRPKSFEFMEARSADDKFTQIVNIVDGDGGVWTALYTLEQQPDGSMKISGCSLLKAGQAV